MKYSYINYDKIKRKNIKYKLFVSVYVLCGVLSLTGCGQSNFNDDVNIQKEEQEYFSQFIFLNLDYLNNEEKDVISVYDNDGNIYTGFYVSDNEENHVVTVPVQNFKISSKMLGRVEINLDLNEEALIYLDYLNNTIKVEKVSSTNKLIR